MTVVPSFEDWLHSQDLSENTIRLRMVIYRSRVEAWPDGWPTSTAVLSGWLREHDGWTRITYHVCLTMIYRWLVETGQVAHDANPMLKVRKPAAPRPKPRPLSEEELTAALAAAEPRTRAFLMLGYLAGLRAHEIAKIHGRDVSRDQIRVVGKGRVSATVPTHPLLWELAQTFPEDAHWFAPVQASRSEHITAERVTVSVRKLFRSLGIDGATHRARHTYGTQLLRGGANLRVVQDLMRHSSLATTALYLGVNDDERVNAVGGLQMPSSVPALAAAAPQAVEPPAVVVTSPDVRLCAEVLDELEVELLRMPDDEARVLFDLGFHAVIAARAAERTGRFGDVDTLEHVTRLLMDDRLSTEDAIVECRTPPCARRRTPTLDLPGTSCEGCGAPRARAVGPVAGPECPPWCREHPEESSAVFTHAGEVAAVGGMRVELRQSVRLDDAGGVVVHPPKMFVLDGDSEVTLPADAATLAALQDAVRVAQG